MQGTEKAVVSEKVCDKIYIFNEIERDVGETKVRGDTHITLQTCTAPADILTYAMKIHTHKDATSKQSVRSTVSLGRLYGINNSGDIW